VKQQYKAQSKFEKLEAQLAGMDPGSRRADKLSSQLEGGLEAFSPWAKAEEKRQYILGEPQAGQSTLDLMPELEFFPGSTVVPQDPYTLEAIEARANQARNDAVSTAASDYLISQLGGGGGGGGGGISGGGPISAPSPSITSAGGGGMVSDPAINKYLKGMYEMPADLMTTSWAQDVMPTIDARFANAGGRGGAQTGAITASQGQLAKGLSDLGSNIFGPAALQAQELATRRGIANLEAATQRYGYDTDAATKGAATRASLVGMAPSTQGMGYSALDELARAGVQREDYERLLLQEEIDKFYGRQDEPLNRIQRMLTPASGLPMAAGGGTTTTDYSQGTQGTSIYHEPKDMRPPMWQTMLGKLI